MCALKRLGCDSVGNKFGRRSFGIGSTRAMAQANTLNNCLQSHKIVFELIIHFNKPMRTRRMPASQEVK